MIKVIFIRVNMKVGTVHLVNHSGLETQLVDGKCPDCGREVKKRLRKKPISSK